MIRQAIAKDQTAIEKFLAMHAETSMFLRSNLEKYGIGISDHARASTYWIETEGSDVKGVFGRSNHGFLMLQAPDATSDFWTGIAGFTTGLAVRGISGVPEQVDTALNVLNLGSHLFVVNKDEPLYSVSLRDVAPLEAQMRLVTQADHELLSTWFTGYLIDTGLTGATKAARLEGKERATAAIANPDVMLLIDGGSPVAMAGINARAVETVQIGGVYTPPKARGRGLARRAVSGLLAAQRGVMHSVLFAADRAAARAYEAIGYKQIGTYRVAMLEKPQILGTL